jgi:asparagine synthetase B (glutamine-hydrolysing)
MPGLALIAGCDRTEELPAALRAVSSRLTSGGAPVRIVVDFADLGFAMAASNPARYPAPQTGCAADGNIVALVEGELLNAASLAARAGLAPDAGAATIVAVLYAEKGAAAIDLLRGHCSVAVIDRLANSALAANDPLGLRPLYALNAPDGTLVVGSSPAAVIGYPSAPRAIDPAGLADFLAFGYGLGEKTLFSGVRCLPPGSLIEWRAGAWRSRQYWRLGTDKPEAAALDGDLEALRDTFNATVADVAQAGGPQLALALSGGMDSRAILSALMVAGIPVQTLTHSVPGATDARISAELAHLARTTHHFYEVRGEDVVSAVAPAVELTGGALVGIDAHPLCFLDDIAGYATVALTGMGGALYKASAASGAGVGVSALDTAGLVDGLYSLLNYKLKPESDFPALVSEAWLPALQAQPRRSVEESIDEVSGRSRARASPTSSSCRSTCAST